MLEGFSWTHRVKFHKMKPNLDLLVVDTHSQYTLGLADISSYSEGFSIINPTIEIEPPGFNRVVQPFSSKSISLYTSDILGLTCGEGISPLNDGVWQVKYSISPAHEYFVEKSFLRTELIQIKFAKAFIQADTYKKEKDTIDYIWALIQGAIASSNKCDNKGAMQKYNLADTILTNYLKK